MGKGRKFNKKTSGTLRHRHLTACISCAEIELPPQRVHSVCHECDSFWLLAHLSCTRLLDAVQINSRIEREREKCMFYDAAAAPIVCDFDLYLPRQRHRERVSFQNNPHTRSRSWHAKYFTLHYLVFANSAVGAWVRASFIIAGFACVLIKYKNIATNMLKRCVLLFVWPF